MKKILMLSLLVLPFLGQAQSTKKSRKDSTVVIFFNENSSGKTKKKKSGEDNIIKIAPLGFVSGSFPISFERKITDFFSIQVGAGLTHKNYWRSLLNSVDIGESSRFDVTYPWSNLANPEYYTDRSAALFNYDDRKASLGYMVSVQPRFYFESDACDGSFMGISLDYSRYNFTIPGVVNNGGTYTQTGAIKKEHENLLDFMVCGGYQSVFDQLTVEYTTGIGLRSVKGEKYVYGSDVYSSNPDYGDGVGTYKQSVFNFNVGIKVGYHF
jgi:hypothetical protein